MIPRRWCIRKSRFCHRSGAPIAFNAPRDIEASVTGEHIASISMFCLQLALATEKSHSMASRVAAMGKAVINPSRRKSSASRCAWLAGLRFCIGLRLLRRETKAGQ